MQEELFTYKLRMVMGQWQVWANGILYAYGLYKDMKEYTKSLEEIGYVNSDRLFM